MNGFVLVNMVREAGQDGPVAGDMQLALQGLSELLTELPDGRIGPARRYMEALFYACERVAELEAGQPARRPSAAELKAAEELLAFEAACRKIFGGLGHA